MTPSTIPMVLSEAFKMADPLPVWVKNDEADPMVHAARGAQVGSECRQTVSSLGRQSPRRSYVALLLDESLGGISAATCLICGGRTCINI